MSVSLSKHTMMRQCLNWLDSHYRDILADHRTKKLFVGSVVTLFLEATLRNRKSIEEICLHLQSRKWLQDWIRLTSVSASALYTRLEEIPLHLLQETHRQLLREIAKCYTNKQGISAIGPLCAVDSTEIVLPPVRGSWAFTTEKKNFVRMHTCLRIDDEISVSPHLIALSTGAVHEQEVLPHLVKEAAATHVFDRGYVNYERFIEWAEAEIPFVARLKRNNRCQILTHQPISEESHIRLDAEVRILHPVKKTTAQLRLVEYDVVDRNSKVKRIRVLTNRRDVSAEAISEIYRDRWQVETFFKWMKQHVHLSKMYSTKENAVWNQIYLSLIAHALCEWVRLMMKPEATCWEFLRLFLIYKDETELSIKQMLARLKPRRRKKRNGQVKPRERPPNRRKSNEKNRAIIT